MHYVSSVLWTSDYAFKTTVPNVKAKTIMLSKENTDYFCNLGIDKVS